MKIPLNLTKFEKTVNIILLIILFSFILTLILYRLFPNPALSILKTALEASLVGALADAYAVFGLFHKLGPHTNLLLRKREELTEKVIDFVSSFIFNEEFLRKELEKINIDLLIERINRERLSLILEHTLTSTLNDYVEQVFIKIRDSLPFYFPKLDSFIENLKENLKPTMKGYLSERLPAVVNIFIDRLSSDNEQKAQIKRALIEYLRELLRENHSEIREIVRRRLEEVSDEDYILMIKSGSWDELQWIRLNGTVLGFLIGFLIGIIEVLF